MTNEQLYLLLQSRIEELNWALIEAYSRMPEDTERVELTRLQKELYPEALGDFIALEPLYSLKNRWIADNNNLLRRE